jgi:hypothetical protein
MKWSIGEIPKGWTPGEELKITMCTKHTKGSIKQAGLSMPYTDVSKHLENVHACSYSWEDAAK